LLNSREELRIAFLEKNNLNTYKIEALPADASNRRYYRLSDNNVTYILMDAPPKQENITQFLNVKDILADIELSVPKVLFQDIENGFLILEDFGNNTYKELLDNKTEENEHLDEKKMYERAIDALAHLHQKGPKNSSLSNFSERKFVDETMIFIDWYVDVLNGGRVSKSMTIKFKEILAHLHNQVKIFQNVVVLRDYHAQNIFWLENEVGVQKVGLIDFQDALIGSPIYDIVSLLQDARRDVSEEIVTSSITRYIKSFPNCSRKDLMMVYSILGVQRNLRIIGLFTKIAMKNKNTNYLALLPRVWRYIHSNLRHPILLPMRNWLEEVIPSQMPNFYAQKSKDLEKVL
jgi:N-acetylmuramate 1-kinase